MYSGSSILGIHRLYYHRGSTRDGLAHGRGHEERHTELRALHQGTVLNCTKSTHDSLTLCLSDHLAIVNSLQCVSRFLEVFHPRLLPSAW